MKLWFMYHVWLVSWICQVCEH